MKIRGKIDPPSVADMWMRSRPRGENRANQMEMWSIVGMLSDNESNLRMLLSGDKTSEKVLYKKKTCGGLLACPGDENPDLAHAGIVADASRSRFEFLTFSMHGGYFGEVYFFPAPMAYAMDDRAMLFGIVQHELRHYMDFLDNGRRPIDTDYIRSVSGGYEIDVDSYARNITEMRAHADQAAALLRIMGGADNAKKAISGSHFGMMMIPEMSKSMMIFIDLLDEENRSSGVKEAIDPPAAVVRSEDHDVRALVGHLQRMFEVMRFSNNVRPKK